MPHLAWPEPNFTLIEDGGTIRFTGLIISMPNQSQYLTMGSSPIRVKFGQGPYLRRFSLPFLFLHLDFCFSRISWMQNLYVSFWLIGIRRGFASHLICLTNPRFTRCMWVAGSCVHLEGLVLSSKIPRGYPHHPKKICMLLWNFITILHILHIYIYI